MKKRLSIIALILVCMITLTACGSSRNGKKYNGYYATTVYPQDKYGRGVGLIIEYPVAQLIVTDYESFTWDANTHTGLIEVDDDGAHIYFSDRISVLHNTATPELESSGLSPGEVMLINDGKQLSLDISNDDHYNFQRTEKNDSFLDDYCSPESTHFIFAYINDDGTYAERCRIINTNPKNK